MKMIIDKWIIGVICYVFVMYAFVTRTFDESFLIAFTPIMLISALAITTSLTLNLVFHYRTKSRRFTTSYVFLSIAFAGYTIAEILYGVFDITGIDPYPSTIVEPFYGVYFVASSMFCLTLFWCRKELIQRRMVIVSILAAVAFFATYLILSLEYVDSEYFATSTIMMIMSSALLGSSTLTTITLWKAPQLRKVWMIIGIALFCNGIADISYYSNINNDHFLYSDVSNIIWFGTALMIFYAAYKHRFLYMRQKQ